jgi:hypothetical protein
MRLNPEETAKVAVMADLSQEQLDALRDALKTLRPELEFLLASARSAFPKLAEMRNGVKSDLGARSFEDGTNGLTFSVKKVGNYL